MSQDVKKGHEFLSLIQGIDTPKTEKGELKLGKRANNQNNIEQYLPPQNTPKEVMSRSPLGQIMSKIGLQIGDNTGVNLNSLI